MPILTYARSKAGTGLLVSSTLAARLLECRHFFLFLSFFLFVFSCVRAKTWSQGVPCGDRENWG